MAVDGGGRDAAVCAGGNELREPNALKTASNGGGQGSVRAQSAPAGGCCRAGVRVCEGGRAVQRVARGRDACPAVLREICRRRVAIRSRGGCTEDGGGSLRRVGRARDVRLG